VRIEGAGLDLRCELQHCIHQPMGDLAEPLRQAAKQEPMTARQFAQLARELGQQHVEVIEQLLDGRPVPDLIAVHGQTIVHDPPLSWQLINPAPIAARFACPIVSDLRQADLAAGGQGAPITPLADWVIFRDSRRHRAIVNLGGFCNITILPPSHHSKEKANGSSGEDNLHIFLQDIHGFDVCACNQLLDHVAREALHEPCDHLGQAAQSGSVQEQISDALFKSLHEQAQAQRSLGSGDEITDLLHPFIQSSEPADLAASVVRAIARTITHVLRKYTVDEIVLAGGGARNQALVNAIDELTEQPLILSETLGIPIEAREAVCIAVLGALCADSVSITLPHITGCTSPAPLSGVWRGITAHPD